MVQDETVHTENYSRYTSQLTLDSSLLMVDKQTMCDV